jgi:hypothetical protein
VGDPFCHLELQTPDVERATEFYGALFDWQLDDLEVDGSRYIMIQTGAETGGGIMHQPEHAAAAQWLPFVDVADLDAHMQKADKLGATIVKQKTHVPDFGWFGVITDPTGAMLGLWQRTS